MTTTLGKPVVTHGIELWVPRPPDNANSRQHWARANRDKRELWTDLNIRKAARLLPAPPSTPPRHATIQVHYHVTGGARLLDHDNATRRMKPVIDWLVAHGYLAGDSPAHLTTLPLTQVREPVPDHTPPLATVRITIAWTGVRA